MLISDNKCKISQINKPTYMLVRGILVCLVPGGLVLNNTSPGHSKVILVRVLFFVNKRAEVNHLRLWGALYSHKVLQVAITRHTIGEYEYKYKVYKYYSVLFWHNFSEFESSKVLFHQKIIFISYKILTPAVNWRANLKIFWREASLHAFSYATLSFFKQN